MAVLEKGWKRNKNLYGDAKKTSEFL